MTPIFDTQYKNFHKAALKDSNSHQCVFTTESEKEKEQPKMFLHLKDILKKIWKKNLLVIGY